MDSVQLHRRPKKFRRTGRHTTPSQVEKVAEKATKAAPAVAIAGALVAVAPQAHAAENGSDGMRRMNFERLGYLRNKGPLTAGGSASYSTSIAVCSGGGAGA